VENRGLWRFEPAKAQFTEVPGSANYAASDLLWYGTNISLGTFEGPAKFDPATSSFTPLLANCPYLVREHDMEQPHSYYIFDDNTMVAGNLLHSQPPIPGSLVWGAIAKLGNGLYSVSGNSVGGNRGGKSTLVVTKIARAAAEEQRAATANQKSDLEAMQKARATKRPRLPNDGYWVGGQEQRVAIHPLAEAGGRPFVVDWRLTFGDKKLGWGMTPIQNPGMNPPFRMNVPPVRERTELELSYTFRPLDKDAKSHDETMPVHLFPNSLIADHSMATAGKTFVVLDADTGIAEFLRQAKVHYTDIKASSRLELLAPDVLLVGAGMLSKSTEWAIMDQVQRGASVLVFAQHAGESIGGYRFEERKAPSSFVWHAEHELFRSLTESDLQSMVENAGEDFVAFQLPANSPSLVLCSWPPEIPRKDADQTGPVDALVATLKIGQGRLVILQLPLKDWQHDPRVQIVLNNALDYLLTRPEPTPRPSERILLPASKPSPMPIENRIPFEEK
jgi:hypothetical protein